MQDPVIAPSKEFKMNTRETGGKPVRVRVAAIMATPLLGFVGCEVEDPDAISSSQPANKQNKNVAASQPEPELTSGQDNALHSAESYVEMMPFSKEGLIDQLSGPGGEGYSKADARPAETPALFPVDLPCCRL